MSILKLILVLALMILAAVLTGFNLSNTCTIWFFHSFSNIPVLAALTGALLLGVLITLPFVFIKKKPRTEKSKKENTSGETAIPSVDETPSPVQEEK